MQVPPPGGIVSYLQYLFIMAKVLGIFSSKLKGKVGPVSYRNTADGNVVYQRAVNVKNPRSYAQQQQRMIFATASAAYSAMKAICDHSWQGVTYGAKTQQAFMRAALDYLRTRAVDNLGNFNIKGNKYMVANALQISDGSLNSVPLAPSLGLASERNYSQIIPSSVSDSFDGSTTTLTVAELQELLPFIQPGDQLTFVQLGVPEGADVAAIYNDKSQDNTLFEYARLVLPTDTSARIFENNRLIGADESVGLDSLRVDILDPDQNGKLSTPTIGFSFDTINYPEATIKAAGVIVSRKVDGVWQRSKSFLVEYENDYYKANEIIGSYAPSSDLYLNHALD